MNKDEKIKLLDDTNHSLKILNSQNLEDFKFAECNITSPHQKTCSRIELFHLKLQREKIYKTNKLPEGVKAPRSLTKPLGPAAANTPHSFREAQQRNSNHKGKRFQIQTSKT
ncbi:hypothetical protein AVEN_52511-1 [Araneus ventricosus]|uniref:Uncharacterized protein n=1 Tax=Araneus ventricosus TaxID=182803 RepID=A0A4Y2U6I4_ARAVE|nr:hypothetical protein AVEN_52511-1 [Araneus ventricosus]